MSKYDWICCPDCGNRDVHVMRNLDYHGGTDGFQIKCSECGFDEAVQA